MGLANHHVEMAVELRNMCTRYTKMGRMEVESSNNSERISDLDEGMTDAKRSAYLIIFDFGREPLTNPFLRSIRYE